MLRTTSPNCWCLFEFAGSTSRKCPEFTPLKWVAFTLRFHSLAYIIERFLLGGSSWASTMTLYEIGPRCKSVHNICWLRRFKMTFFMWGVPLKIFFEPMVVSTYLEIHFVKYSFRELHERVQGFQIESVLRQSNKSNLLSDTGLHRTARARSGTVAFPAVRPEGTGTAGTRSFWEGLLWHWNSLLHFKHDVDENANAKLLDWFQ